MCHFLKDVHMMYPKIPILPHNPQVSHLLYQFPFHTIFRITMALPHDPLIKRLEDERQKYYSETHQPTTSQLNRFGAGCQLLKEDPQVLRQNKSSTRQRKSTAQYNLSKIARLSSSVFTLICFVIGFTELGSKSHLELNPKLRSWWENAARPKRLLKLVQEICDEEGIEYVETSKEDIYFLIFPR